MTEIIKGDGRYSDSEVLTYIDNKNKDIQYLSRRFIPTQQSQKILGVQEVQTGDRPDLVAYRAYGNPLLFYHIADYNLSVNPFTLTSTSGRLLIVPFKTT